MSSFLFINQFFWPDEAATAQLLEDLTQDLASVGHQVTVLCGRARYACREKRLEAGTFRHGAVTIERVGGTDCGRYRTSRRLLDIFSFMRAAGRRLRTLPRHDAVVAMTSPPLVAELGVRYQKRHSVPFVFWAQDVYPDVAERLGVIRNRLLCSWLHARMARVCRAARRIVAPGRDVERTLAARAASPDCVKTIPNWADTGRILCTPVRENVLRRAQGWEHDRILMYAGNVGAAHDLETLLALVSQLEVEMPALRFVVVGDSPRHEALARRASKMGIRRVTSLPSQPRESLGEMLGAADAHLVSQKPEVDGLLVPSKFYGVVAAGRPVIFIGSKTSEVGRCVSESQLGVVIEPGQAASGVRAALRVLHLAQEDAGTVAFLRDWAERHASRKIRTREFGRLLEEVVS